MKFREMIEQFTGRLKEVIGKMTPSQRMSLGMIAGVVALAFVILVVVSLSDGAGGWEKLFYTALEPDQQQYVISKLGAEAYKIEDGAIMVHASERARLAAMFLEDQRVNTEPDFFASLFEPNLIETDRLSDIKYVRARERQLESWIGNYKQIKSARVGINRGDSGALLNLDQRKPTASVQVELASGVQRLPKNTVRAIAATVSGPIKGLNPADVKISDTNGYPYDIEDGSGYDSEQIAMKREIEDDYAKKIREVLDIPGMGIGVNIQLDLNKRITRSETITGDVPVETHTEEVTSGGEGGTGGAVGVQPNTGTGAPDMGIVAGESKPSGPGGYTSKSKTTKPLSDAVSRKIEDEEKNGPEIKKIKVGLMIPYNYLVTPTGGGEAPTDPAELEQIKQQKIKELLPLVKNIAGVDDESDISIIAKPVFEKEEGEDDSMASSVLDSITPYLGKVFIALIAFGSLLLVASFVKKNIPKPQQIPIEEIEQKIEQEVAKEKKDFLSELSKLDENEMKAIQVKDRVQEMVTENPENAASLLKTWINREE